MLVLSRKENESIVFPKLGISVQVTRLSGRVVKLGIDAPEDVRVFRGELVDQADHQPSGASPQPASSSANEGNRGIKPQTGNCKASGNCKTSANHESAESQLEDIRSIKHSLRNRLNAALLGLQLMQAKIESGEVDDLEGPLFQLFQNLCTLNSDIERTFQSSPVASDQLGSAARSNHGSSVRALIVDDSPNEAQLLAQYLQLNGYAVEVVPNGREAIQWLRQNERPDVVLMDMNMPEMSGPETIGQIRNDDDLHSLRLFGVSGMEQEDAGVETGSEGVDRWFTKPVDARKLLQEIKRDCVTNIA